MSVGTQEPVLEHARMGSDESPEVPEEGDWDTYSDFSGMADREAEEKIENSSVEEWIENLEFESTADVPIPDNLVNQ